MTGNTSRKNGSIHALLIATLLVSCTSTHGQTATPSAQTQEKLPSFEVVTIKPIDPNNGGTSGFKSRPGGRVTIGFADLRMMIYYAFNIPMKDILGVPDWAEKQRYDIAAIPPPASESATAKQAGSRSNPGDEQRKMLQSLLIERFNLKCHREVKEGPVYILTRGTGKLHLEEPRDRDGDYGMGISTNNDGTVPGKAGGTNITMAYFAATMTGYLDRPVIDQTGLTDKYDFHLEPNDPTNTDGPTALFGIVKRLGLKLTPGKGPIETIVIDSVTKPTEN